MIKRTALFTIMLLMFSVIFSITWSEPVPVVKSNGIINCKSIVNNDEIISIWAEKDGIESFLKLRKTSINGDYLTEEMILFEGEEQIITFELEKLEDSFFVSWATTTSYNSRLYLVNVDFEGSFLYEPLIREFQNPFIDLGCSLKMYSNNDIILVFCNLNLSIQVLASNRAGDQIHNWEESLNDVGYYYEDDPFDGIWHNNQFHLIIDNSKYYRLDPEGNILHYQGISNYFNLISFCFELNGSAYYAASDIHGSEIYRINEESLDLVAELDIIIKENNSTFYNNQLCAIEEASIYLLNDSFEIVETISGLPEFSIGGTRFISSEYGFYLCNVMNYTDYYFSTILHIDYLSHEITTVEYDCKSINIFSQDNSLVLSSYDHQANPEVTIYTPGSDLITTIIGSIDEWTMLQSTYQVIGENTLCFVWHNTLGEYRVQFLDEFGNKLLQEEGVFLSDESMYTDDWYIEYNNNQFLLMHQIGNTEIIYFIYNELGQQTYSGNINFQPDDDVMIADIFPFSNNFAILFEANGERLLQIIVDGVPQAEGIGLQFSSVSTYRLEILGNFIKNRNNIMYLNNNLEYEWEIELDEQIINAHLSGCDLFITTLTANSLSYSKIDQSGNRIILNEIVYQNSSLYFQLFYNGYLSFISDSEIIFIQAETGEITIIPNNTDFLLEYPYFDNENYFVYRMRDYYSTKLCQINVNGNLVSEELFSGFCQRSFEPFSDGLYTYFTHISNFYYSIELGLYAYYFDPQPTEIFDNEAVASDSDFSVYPNPFNPRTSINLSLNNESKVEISIFNIKGQKLNTLVNQKLPKGNHSIEWNGEDYHGNESSSGIYFVRVIVDSETYLRKCMLIK